MNVMKPYFGHYGDELGDNHHHQHLYRSSENAEISQSEQFRVHHFCGSANFNGSGPRFLGDFDRRLDDQPDLFDVSTYDSFVSNGSDLGSFDKDR